MTMKFRTSKGATFTVPFDSNKGAEWDSMRTRICQSISPDYSTCEFFYGELNPIDDSDRIRHLKYQPNSYVYCFDRGPSRPLVQTEISRVDSNGRRAVSHFLDIRLRHNKEPKSWLAGRPPVLGFGSGVHAFASAAMYKKFHREPDTVFADIVNRIEYADAALADAIRRRPRLLIELLGCRFAWMDGDVGVFMFPEPHLGDGEFTVFNVEDDDILGMFEIYRRVPYFGIEEILRIYIECAHNLVRTARRVYGLAGMPLDDISRFSSRRLE
jgi:hypothetical protein